MSNIKTMFDMEQNYYAEERGKKEPPNSPHE